MKKFFETDSSETLLGQRLVLASVIGAHGAQKLFGWFGGYGFEATLGFFTGTLGLPAVLGVLVILGESLGMLALALGAFTRLAAGGVVAIMLGAVATVHYQYGFFMNWSGQQAGEGFELHLLALALAVPLAVRGAGAWSIDRVIARVLSQSPRLGTGLLPTKAAGS